MTILVGHWWGPSKVVEGTCDSEGHLGSMLSLPLGIDIFTYLQIRRGSGYWNLEHIAEWSCVFVEGGSQSTVT